MKKLKQALSLTLALVLSLALAAPAFAADYQEITLIPYYETNHPVTFSAARLGEPVTKNTYIDWEEATRPLTFIPLILQPNCQIKVPDDVEDYVFSCGYICTFPEDGNPRFDGGVAFSMKSESIEDFFDKNPSTWPSGEKIAPIFQTADDSLYWIMLEGDSAAAPAEPAKPAVTIPEGSVAYTVQKGDTLGFIATNFYGSNAQREALYQANIEAFRATKGALKPGMVLAIPAVLGKAVRIAAPVAGEGEKLYTVKLGDTLGQIAAAEYGNANAYKAIFERNSDRLKDVNTIYEGQVIVLPAKK